MPVTVVLDKPRTLRFSMWAMKAYEREAKQSILAIDWTKINVTDISILLWAGLLHEDEKLTVRQVDNMVDESNFVTVLAAVVKAWKAAVVPKGGGTEDPFGETSGPSGDST